MTKRPGLSLLNVMVFMLFAVMITAQVFFFAKSSSDSLAEGREIMLYRLQLDSLVEALRKAGECKADAITLSLDDRNESLMNGLLEERDELIREAMWLYAELHSKLERSGDDAGVELE